MKKKVILSSVLTILLCLSLIMGSTYALFTSEKTVSIGVTAGKVKIDAKIDSASLKLYSREEAQTETFKNGGTATFNNTCDVLTLTNITPGDEVRFTINVTNYSNVAIQYRVTWAIEGVLSEVLVATAKPAGATSATAIQNNVPTWTEWNIPADPEAGETTTIEVVVKLPLEVGNDYQLQTADITFLVEAVQGNGQDVYETYTQENS